MKTIKTWFLTYGSGDDHPFDGGWAQISAESREEAWEKHRKIFGMTKNGFGRYAFDYSEEEWAESDMGSKGNQGAYCQIVL